MTVREAWMRVGCELKKNRTKRMHGVNEKIKRVMMKRKERVVFLTMRGKSLTLQIPGGQKHQPPRRTPTSSAFRLKRKKIFSIGQQTEAKCKKS